ncbi:MAG: hypothetical protein ACI4EF_09945 [Coprococcus sp.]
MQDSEILSQVVKIVKTDRKTATHFALCNGSLLRYLVDMNGGKKRLSKNISPYSRKLGLLMRFLEMLPFSVLAQLGFGYFVEAALHDEVEEYRQNTQKQHWNMIVGTYDEKQKVVLQCFDQGEYSVYIKVGNAATEKELNAEISFLRNNRCYTSFDIPQLLDSTKRADGSSFNLLVTKEFSGCKVEPMLTREIVDIYRELSMDTNDGLAFSHGDFAPWNLKKNQDRYTLFDWEHCGYRMPGFDLMHYVTIVQSVLNKKNLSEAFDDGLEEIHVFLPDFQVEKEDFLTEFKKLRTQIT